MAKEVQLINNTSFKKNKNLRHLNERQNIFFTVKGAAPIQINNKTDK